MTRLAVNRIFNLMEVNTMTHAMQPVLDSADAAPAAGAVTASVNYLVPPLGRNTVYVASHGGGESRRTGQYVSTPVSVHDARRLSRPAGKASKRTWRSR